MKILFQSRSTLYTVPGGDTVQIEKTKKYIELQGHQVDITTELEPDLTGYDLVHLFNLTRPQDLLAQARNAKRQHIPIALSTIYGLYTEYDRTARGSLSRIVTNLLPTGKIEYLKTVARAIKNEEFHAGISSYLKKGHSRSQNEILSYVDVLLPNSESELVRTRADFPVSRIIPAVVVPNAVDIELYNYEHTRVSPEVAPFQDSILCVARIEGRKNQLNLVRAARDLPFTLVLVGKAAPNHLAYFEQVKREAGPNVQIIGQLDHSLLPEFYKVAKVHVLPSWMETPGLSSIEAGVMHCNLVVTEKGDPRDYFGDFATYCDPNSIASIAEALTIAFNRSYDKRLKEHILNNFTWERTARKTLEGYQHALK
jgi:glycosyltransferase involved in cell wall biosynthesis